MVNQKPDTKPSSNVPPTIAVPTEAEVRAADLEQDDAKVRQVQAEDRETRIREAAYSRAEQRGFAPGHEDEDWLEAERAIDRD
ncbi:DUF2934 domain-containing protein [Variovorax sp. GT1P44]|uniref:DUF2934 domain-containing protein n=1 Tax=Variovorax sp. GT1P44 TaxID=3443742 RepID=UPI003F458B17